MGIFTTINHAGAAIQIKTGADELDAFEVGETIPCRDDIYAGTSRRRGWWVLVEGGKVARVEPSHPGDSRVAAARRMLIP